MIGGRISKARTCVVLTGNVIKRHLGLPLDPDEAEIEDRLGAHRAFGMPEESVPL